MKRILSLICLVALLMPAVAQKRDGKMDIDVEQVRKLQIAQLAVTSLYVDSVDQKKLVEDAINGMLEKLDPHSSYSNAEETKKIMDKINESKNI